MPAPASAPRTWHCEEHGLDVPVRSYSVAGVAGSYREACPECDRAGREATAADMEEAALREAERARLESRIHAEIPRRYCGAVLNPEVPSAVRTELEAFIEAPALTRTGFIFLGPTGTGKTYAACAVIGGFLDRRRSAVYLTARGAIRRIKAAWRSEGEETEEDVADWFAGLDLLVLDELGVDLGSTFEVSHLTDIINARYAEEVPTILVGNLTPGELSLAYGDRIMDRFREDGRVLVFSGPSRRGRA